MERLTCNELKTIRDGFFIHKGNRKDGAKYRMLAESSPKYEEIYRKLAEYEDAEEQGLLVKLPCAIGSDIYFIPSKAHFGLNILHKHEEFNRVYHQKIARLHFVESGWYVEGNLNLEYGVVDRIFVDKSYKETWFLSQEEAEQELEKMKQSHKGLIEMCRN